MLPARAACSRIHRATPPRPDEATPARRLVPEMRRQKSERSEASDAQRASVTATRGIAWKPALETGRGRGAVRSTRKRNTWRHPSGKRRFPALNNG
ncbi:hypothetical protein MRX96_013668 [Rhipicephalus microplus]